VIDEVPDLGTLPEFQWFFYDEEAQFYKLLESCNIKGIRERRLNENLRKVAERLKLKKMKKPKADAAAAQPANGQQTITSLLSKPKAEKEDKNVDMQNEGKKEEASNDGSESEQERESPKLQDRHCLFENDDFNESIMNAAWYGKKMPTKRQVLQEGRSVGTRGRPSA